ncbi:PREDICTED: uncharacterized protein LOC108373390 [Rhagoletis zephyria]|uniref:uncharacterized protein LOC108373390 n=1 Tax=Rhagoletis zephyria TaxID=28612 RepID=UPI0008118C7F|nr:PREDICTED: uncharacterized protein LOC108373390 [Rhagoletis zephyria]
MSGSEDGQLQSPGYDNYALRPKSVYMSKERCARWPPSNHIKSIKAIKYKTKITNNS